MQISSNSLGLIRTIIENEGFYPSQSELLRAINSLLPDGRTNSQDSPVVLAHGESVIVVNSHDDTCEVFDSIEGAKKNVEEFLVDRSHPADYVSDITVYIARKELTPSITTAVTFE